MPWTIGPNLFAFDQIAVSHPGDAASVGSPWRRMRYWFALRASHQARVKRRSNSVGPTMLGAPLQGKGTDSQDGEGPDAEQCSWVASA
jgi:hypothetical protein